MGGLGSNIPNYPENDVGNDYANAYNHLNKKIPRRKTKVSTENAKQKIQSPRVVGHAVEHSMCNGEIKITGLKAQKAHGQVRLEIKQGSTTIHILSQDWEFFKKQGDELLGKMRLTESK